MGTARIAPAISIFEVEILRSHSAYFWQGTDGYHYEAKMYEAEETGPYFKVSKIDHESANAAEQVWHLSENTDILRLIANGAMAPDTRSRTHLKESN